jgi:hypothetical protein
MYPTGKTILGSWRVAAPGRARDPRGDILCCLEKAVHDRIASIADLAQALSPILPSTARTID